ncbi:hypothetical protein [Photobacterium kishitanii]|uniref:Uncharacterized protein n=1 Tax=Photobacterium kishitanii TaxID=318456 RepID=A0A2T3KL96_9GAMM|nr:hypothetical protein [Photobacterium kishitanii]PSV00429.1 hypothetical protein C9J27_04675 [Photobacterium kishitanii]
MKDKHILSTKKSDHCYMVGDKEEITPKVIVYINGQQVDCYYGENAASNAEHFVVVFNKVINNECPCRRVVNGKYSNVPFIEFNKRYLSRFAYWAKKHAHVNPKFFHYRERFPEYFNAFGRNVRILSSTMKLQVSDDFFDRWANSLGASYDLPKTELEFISLVKTIESDIKNNRYNLHFNSEE